MSGSVGDGGESGEKPIPAAIELAKPGEPGEPGEPELEGVWLPAKSTKPGRFFLDTVFFAISEGSSHPRTTMPILKTAKAEERAEAEVRPEVRPEVRKVKKYLIFLSFFYVTNSERPDPGFFSRLGREPKLLGSSHPAVTLSRSPEDLKNYQDVNRVVFFGQLMAAFLSGTRVRVPDVRKVTDAMYRSEWIANLSVNVDLNTYFTEEIKGYRENTYASLLAFLAYGGMHFLVANKVFRNADCAKSNIGAVKSGLVAFDFDQYATLDTSVPRQADLFGFSERGVDRAGWLPPVKPDVKYAYGDGPLRWIDRTYAAGKRGFDVAYHAEQSWWRRIHHHREAVHIQHYLYFKFLLMNHPWFSELQTAFLGEKVGNLLLSGGSYLEKVSQMQADCLGSLLCSAIFRLDLFMNSARYESQLQKDFELYNLAKWSKKKPENERYKLFYTAENFAQIKSWFFIVEHLSETASFDVMGDADRKLYQDQKMAYLQFLILLSHARGYTAEKAVYDPNLPGFRELRDSLDSVHERKLRLFIVLFSTIKMDCSYSELFFLCKVFDILYPTHQRESEKGLMSFWSFSDLPMSIERKDAAIAPYSFPASSPCNVSWALSHFSVEALTSPEAMEKFPVRLVDSEWIGEEFREDSSRASRQFARQEACLEMAALIRNQIALSREESRRSEGGAGRGPEC